MNGFTLIRRNLFEKRGRTLLLCLSTMVAFLIFGLLNGFLNMTDTFENPASQTLLMVINRTGLLRSLPVAYAERIRAVEGVKNIASVRIFGGYVADPRDSVNLMMADPEDYLAVNDLAGLAPSERAAFVSARDGVIVDAATAAARGWAVGDQVTIRSMLHVNANGGNEWPFTIKGIFAAESEDGPQNGMLGHLEYLNENVALGRDMVNWVTVVTTSPEAGDAVASRIDALFANSAHETSTMSETAMAQAFLGQLGDLNKIVTFIVGAAFLALLFAIGNTTALAIRQRSRQIGVMKALGFTPGRIMRMILAETMLLSLLGAAMGLGLAAFLLSLALGAMRMPVPLLGLPTVTVAWGLGLAFALGLLTGILPAIRAMRVSPATAFGRG